MKFSRPMKISLSLSALIFVLGGIFRWQEHQRLEIIRASHALLVAEAAGVGITLDSTQPEANMRLIKYERKNNTIDVKKIVSEYAANLGAALCHYYTQTDKYQYPLLY